MFFEQFFRRHCDSESLGTKAELKNWISIRDIHLEPRRPRKGLEAPSRGFSSFVDPGGISSRLFFGLLDLEVTRAEFSEVFSTLK